MVRFVTFLSMFAIAWVAHATQVIPSAVDYTNDTIEQGATLQACVINAAIISPPAPEVVSFQFLVVSGRVGFKVTAGDMNWRDGSIIAKRISQADFSTGQFNRPRAFAKDITPEGQLVAVLIDPSLKTEFTRAFFGGHYLVEFKRTDKPEVRSYYIEQAPDKDVRDRFEECFRAMK